MGMAYTPAYSSFIPYFNKYLAAVFSITTASSGVGILALPPFIELLVRKYSWQGALLIMSAIMANICICGALLCPRVTNTKSMKRKMQRRTNTRTNNNKYRFHTLSENEDSSTIKTTSLKFAHDISADFDLHLFRNVTFLFTVILGACLEGATTTFTIYLVPYAVTVGISETNASTLLLLYGMFIVLARLSPFGWIVDKKIITASTLGGVGHLVLGAVMILIPYITNFVHLLGICVVYGVSHGLCGPMLHISIAESPGDKTKAKGAMAWAVISYGVGCLISIFLAGKL